MTFRTRVLLAFVPVVLVPLVVFGLGVRRVVREGLTGQFEARVAALVGFIRDDLAREGEALGTRLALLCEAAGDDNRFRSAAVQGALAERQYLLDYAGTAMRLASLDMLQIQDETGRILSSGHFRNEFDRLEPGLPRALAAAPGGMALVRARTPETPFLALARVDTLRLGGRTFTLVGGLDVAQRLLAGLPRDPELGVSIVTPEDDSTATGDASVVDELELPYVGSGPTAPTARVVVSHSPASLSALQRGMDVWFLVAVLVSGAATLLLAGWLASRVTRPLTELARQTATVDMNRLDVRFESEREDEVGALARLLGDMTTRLKAGAARLREFERRAAMGDLARQVNHDIKNGLAPIRNVFRHLGQVAQDAPSDLPRVFAERQGTVESSVGYLESLAANYARLYPETEVRPVDVNDVVRETLRHVAAPREATMATTLPDDLPPVPGDALVLRRIIENLLGNAIDALGGQPGAVTISTERADGKHGEPAAVRIVVADTGRGMSKAELDRAFDDFYTTKPGGTGLGLSIVRRLVLDLKGRLRVETEPGQGTRFIVELPAHFPG
jgi:two-component system, NtrC family, nitrogen regulation sensor histidine kinase NtrY